MKFTENLRTTVESYVKKIQAKDTEIADHQKNGINVYSDAKYKEIALDLNDQRSTLMTEAVNAAKTIIDEYKAELPKRFAANGADLNAGDVALLNSGYKLNANDVKAMFDRYAPNNHTMLRCIVDYAHHNGMEIDRTYYGEKEKAEAAESMLSYARSCFQRPDYGMETEAYFAEICPDALVNE